jgi:predicted ester cyclase
MGDFPATGNRVESKFLAIFRIEEGKIAELWVEWDNVAMLTQLGLFPGG